MFAIQIPTVLKMFDRIFFFFLQNKHKDAEKTFYDFAGFMVCGACSKTCATIVAYPHGNFSFYPPASEVSREVANLTERKYPHTPVYGVAYPHGNISFYHPAS